MSGKPTLALALLVLLTGCADPKYVSGGSGGNGGSNKPGTGGIACDVQFSTSRSCISMKWIKKPGEKTMGEFTLRAFQIDPADNFPIPVELTTAPEVLLWMPSMGHGSSPVTVTAQPGGSFRATNVFFVMPGEWQIKFQIKQDKIVSDEAVLDYVF